MADTMTNEEIVAEFEGLFGGTEDSDEDKKDPTEDTETKDDKETEDETEEETSEDSDEDEEEEDEEEEETEDTEKPEESKDSTTKKGGSVSKEAKQNYAFAELRNQNKKNEQFIRGLGKLIGMDDNASVDDVKAKIKDVLITKEAKDNNISVELAKRLDIAEELIQENKQVKLEKKVTEDFTELIEKHGLGPEEVQEFTQWLSDNGKNPLENPDVDIASEYLKLHYEDMVQKAVDAALEKEKARKKKVKEQSPSAVDKGVNDKDEKKTSSVKELDDLFAGLDL